MNAKVLVFVICVEVIIYLLLYNWHDCAFKEKCRKKYYPFYVILFNVYDVLLIAIRDIRYPMRKLFIIAFLL